MNSSGTANSKLVAIVVPLHNRPCFTPNEKTSLRHLAHYLGPYDKYLVGPRSLTIHRPGYELKRFHDGYFGSVIAYTRLLLSQEFYASFDNYQYILIYHTDALVFSDQLLQWCSTGLDYIGAPWLKCEATPWVGTPRVGNGGFSLRKVRSFLKVMQSPRYWIDPNVYWESYRTKNPKRLQSLNIYKKYLKRIRLFNNVRRELSQWHLRPDGSRNEDHFWSDEARRYCPDFRIASVETGLKFAFEAAPRLCFELNGGQLPFGCHAWHRYDRTFWEPYLLK